MIKVAKFLGMVVLVLLLAQTAAGIAAPMIADMADAIGVEPGKLWKLIILGGALFVLANLGSGAGSAGHYRRGRW